MFISLRIAILLAITTRLGSVWTKELPCAQDVAFLIDDSASLNQSDFDEQISFVKKLIENFDVGPTKTRVAAVTFSNKTKVELTFKEGTDKDSVTNKLMKIKHNFGQRTNTYEGLAEVRKTVYKAGNGERPGKPDVLILLTDGNSHRQDLTKIEAEKIKAKGIRIIAIGIGNVNETLLTPIATPPTSENYFYVKRVKDLKNILESVGRSTCDVTTTTTAPPPITTPDSGDEPCSASESEIVIGLVGIEGSVRDLVRKMIVSIGQTFKNSKGNIWFGIREGCVNAESTLSTDLYAVTSLVTDVSWKTVQGTISNVRSTFTCKKSNKAAILFINTDASYLGFDKVMAELKELKNIANVAIVGIGNSFSAAELKNLNLATRNFIHGEIPVFAWNGLDINEVPIFMKQLNKLLCNDV